MHSLLETPIKHQSFPSADLQAEEIELPDSLTPPCSRLRIGLLGRMARQTERARIGSLR